MNAAEKMRSFYLPSVQKSQADVSEQLGTLNFQNSKLFHDRPSTRFYRTRAHCTYHQRLSCINNRDLVGEEATYQRVSRRR